jgi:hypothetical protein
MIFQAAFVALSASASPMIGRCVTAISSATSAGTSAAKIFWNFSCSM